MYCYLYLVYYIVFNKINCTDKVRQFTKVKI